MATMSAIEAGRSASRQGRRLAATRAENSATSTRPISTSITPTIVLRGTNDVTTTKTIVAMSKARTA